MSDAVHPVRAVDYELQIELAASPAKVWKALVKPNKWWLREFHCAAKDSKVVLEAVPGGRFFEETGTGGLLWFHVLHVEVEKVLHLAGHIAPPWGGPATTLVRITLEKYEKGTTLKLRDSLVGYVSDKEMESLRSGWNKLIAGLKAYVEHEK